jgi:DNA-directed RNA polymerase specialized sigma24 family protein
LVRASNHSLDPAQRAKARDEWDIVAKAVNALTEEQRQVLMGRLIQGNDVASCAHTWENANAAKALQFHALQSLQHVPGKQQYTNLLSGW